MGNRRRTFLAGVGSAVASAVSGCLDTSDGNTTPGPNRKNESETPLSLETTYAQYQYDAANTGVVPDVGGPTGAVSSIFTFGGASDDSGQQIGSPSLTDRTLYLTAGNRGGSGNARTIVYAIDATNGVIEWQTRYADTTVAGPTALAGDRVIAGIGGSVVGLDRSDGSKAWSRSLNRRSGITVDGDTAYTVGIDGTTATLSALAVTDGTIRWQTAIDAQTHLPTPAIDGDTVYVGGQSLQALDAATGAEQWRTENTVSAPPTVTEDSVLVGSEDTLRAYESDGTERWATAIETASDSDAVTVSSSPVVDDDTAYVVADRGLSAYAMDDGNNEYARPLDITGTPVIADGYLYTVGPGQLVCLSTADGTTEWSYGTEQRTETDGVAPIVASDVAYFPAEKLYAIT